MEFRPNGIVKVNTPDEIVVGDFVTVDMVDGTARKTTFDNHPSLVIGISMDKPDQNGELRVLLTKPGEIAWWVEEPLQPIKDLVKEVCPTP